ncbi:cupin domain-containing protein [Acidocella sp.]|uniref:cupin domain-containing protein n=1 Tax=Acidocella sp. TaxID=50710 RepID=UPI0026378963|nr:cupin domain-containing protein [Acidocella sp.]
MNLSATLQELLSRIPGAPSEQWPKGERYALAFSHGSMSVGYYAPVGADPQKPHKRDEIYIIHIGTGELVIAGVHNSFAPGHVFFVASGVEHRFENFSQDFATWVVFWGPHGGELQT